MVKGGKGGRGEGGKGGRGEGGKGGRGGVDEPLDIFGLKFHPLD